VELQSYYGENLAWLIFQKRKFVFWKFPRNFLQHIYSARTFHFGLKSTSNLNQLWKKELNKIAIHSSGDELWLRQMHTRYRTNRCSIRIGRFTTTTKCIFRIESGITQESLLHSDTIARVSLERVCHDHERVFAGGIVVMTGIANKAGS